VKRKKNVLTLKEHRVRKGCNAGGRSKEGGEGGKIFINRGIRGCNRENLIGTP